MGKKSIGNKASNDKAEQGGELQMICYGCIERGTLVFESGINDGVMKRR